MNSSVVLPSSPQHEQGIIVALMLDPGAAETVFSLLSPSDCYKDAHRLIMEEAQRLNEKGEPCDLPTLNLSLRASGKIEKVGGAAYLASLPDQCPIPTDLKYYCRKIASLSEKRRLADAGNKILQAAQRMDEGIEDAGDLAQRVVAEALDRRVGHDNKSRIFDFEPIDAVDIVVPDFIINPLVEGNSLFSIFGDPGTYKSIIADEMMACTATGEPFFGMSVKKGPVVYICGEGRSGVRRRFKAWEIVRQVPLDGAPLLVSNGAMALCDDAQTALTLKRLEAAADKYGPPALVVIDTLARNFGPGDENSTADMTKAVAAADRIRQLYGSAVGLVHHSGIIDKNRGRGNSALKGALDAEYKMDINKEKVITLEPKKMKDAAFPEPMSFKPCVVALGVYGDGGDEMTSVVLRQVDYEPKAPSMVGMGQKQQTAMKVLSDLYDKHRHNVEASGGDPKRARVEVDHWKRGCEAVGIDGKSFYDIRVRLVKRGAVKVEGVFAYLT